MNKTNIVAGLVLVALAASLTGCGNKEAEEAAARKQAEQEAAKIVLKQGNGKVRKWGESGFVDVSKVPSSGPAGASQNPEKGK